MPPIAMQEKPVARRTSYARATLNKRGHRPFHVERRLMLGEVTTQKLQTAEALYAVVDWRGPSSQPMHEHAQERVIFVLDGALDESMGGATYRCESGSVIVRAANERHQDAYVGSGRYIGVALADADLGNVFARLAPRGHHVTRAAALHDLGMRLAIELRTADAWSAIGAHGLLLEAAALLGRTRSESARSPKWLPAALEMLGAESATNWTIALLAERVGQPPSEVARAFRRHAGIGVGAYLRRRRLAQARALLVERERPLVAIAAELGFCDQSHFNRSFRRAFGTTPAEYRRAVARKS